MAGEVNLSWDASATAEGYRVYSSVSSGEYSTPALEVGPVTSVPFTALLDGCVRQFLVVTAFNVAGESGFSDELALYPRPVFLAAPYIEGDHIALDGGNFAPGVTLTINNVAVPFVVVDCSNIDVPVLTLPIPVQGQPMTFQVCNGPICQQESIPIVPGVTGFAAI